MMKKIAFWIRASITVCLMFLGLLSIAQKTGFDSTSIKKGVSPDPKTMPYKGSLLSATSWEDANGTNVLIFSKTDAYIINNTEELRRAEFYACCYSEGASGVILLWDIFDFVDSCWCDCDVSLKETTLMIKDLDGDGVAENLFVYVLNERCDASPVRTKLMMHSGNSKMVIRGFSEQFLGDTEVETNRFRQELGLQPLAFKEVDASFDRFPVVFKNYASQFWDKYIEAENEKFRSERKN